MYSNIIWNNIDLAIIVVGILIIGTSAIMQWLTHKESSNNNKEIIGRLKKQHNAIKDLTAAINELKQ